MALAVAGPRARAKMAPEVLMEVMVRRAVVAEQAEQVEAPPRPGLGLGLGLELRRRHLEGDVGSGHALDCDTE
eukprot:scaffold34968_cov43-Phaeocystis_antarctica.AAC.1